MTERIALLLGAMVIAVLCLVVAVLSAETTAAAEPAHVVSSAADTRIVENAATTNYGSGTTIQVDGDDPGGTGKDKSGLINWNLSNIPVGSKVSSASVTVNVTDASANTYQAHALKRTFALSPALVQGWVDNPAGNNGIIVANATNTDGFDFSSRESPTSNLRPQLNITYTAS